MGLFTSFYSGVAGIHTAQSGLNTTAHNTANTKTAGYTRQQNLQTDNYYQWFKTTDKAELKIGYGSQVNEIRQIRDMFLDREYRTEIGRQEFYDVQYTTAMEIEDVLGEMEGVEFNNALEKIWENIEDMSTNPELITQREVFITEAEAFLEKASNVYQSLREYQINLNTQIEAQVNAINKIADQISKLNMQIAKAESSNLENANDYRDQRNLLMDQLAKYTSYEYNETPNHMVTIRLNNAPLVEDTNVHHLKCEKIQLEEYDEATGEYKTTATTQMYNVVWESGGYGDLYRLDKAYSRDDDSDVGSLLGILTARGRKYGYYTDIPVRSDYDSNIEYDRAVKEYNNTTGNCLLEKMEAQFDLLIHKVVTAINDALAPNLEFAAGTTEIRDDGGTSQSKIETSDGKVIDLGATDAGGNKVVSVTVDGVTKEFKNIHILDASRCPVGSDDDATIGTELFVRKAEDDGERYHIFDVDGPLYITDENGKQVEITQRIVNTDPETGYPILDASGRQTYSYKLYLYREEDPQDVNTLYTLQNLEVNQKLLENYSYLPVMGNPATGHTGEYDYKDVFNNMLENWRKKDTQLDPNALSVYGGDDYYRVMVGALGTQGSIWKSQLDNQEDLTNSIEDKRQQISGVSTDEEMVSLLMYQHAYNAASRYITVIDEMLEHLIERLG